MQYLRTLAQTIPNVFIVLCVFLTVTAFAQENPCDPDLDPLSKNPLRYELRGDRCEGLYHRNKTSSILSLVSLTEFFEEYSLKSPQEIAIEWKVPKAQKARLRAQSIKQDLFYRMDTIRASSETSYRWPNDVLRKLSISRWDIGLIGWGLYSLDGHEQNVCLPLRVTQSREAVPSETYQVQLWPIQELEEVFISTATINPDGSPKTFLQDGEVLGYGFYPAKRVITFEIPKPEKPGIYYLEVGATLSSGGVVTIEYWFYHAG